MKRLELTWLVFAQAVHALSLLTWLQMLDFIRTAFAGPDAGQRLIWPQLATALAMLYPILMLAGSSAAWWHYAKQRVNLALILISLPLFLSLPLTAYGFVVTMALR